MDENYLQQIGALIGALRASKRLTQAQFAKKLGTSQPAINRIEKGKQNISFDMIAKIEKILGGKILIIGESGCENVCKNVSLESQLFEVNGGEELSGEITVNTSKNAAVGLLCASILNKKTTTITRVARIEEVYRIIEVLNSIGFKTEWLNDGRDLKITPPARIKLENINLESARRTRSIIMFFGPLLHRFKKFRLPYAGGCSLGARTVTPHLLGLKPFGLNISATCTSGFYEATVDEKERTTKKYIVLTERGDTVTENILMAAALNTSETIIVNASLNYMVQDVIYFLRKLGVKINVLPNNRISIIGKKEIAKDVEFSPNEDPIEAMSFLAAGIVTKSEITVKRVPLDYLEIELEVLRNMNQKMEFSKIYKTKEGESNRLVDITLRKSNLVAPQDKIHPMPFPGLNIDCLPFFSVIAATAKGKTLIHDWVFENRAIYITELSKLNANIELLDPHRVYIHGPTNWRPAEVVAPPALRPSVVVLLAMLIPKGKSVLRNIYNINRGYEDFAKRLRSLGADIK